MYYNNSGVHKGCLKTLYSKYIQLCDLDSQQLIVKMVPPVLHIYNNQDKCFLCYDIGICIKLVFVKYDYCFMSLKCLDQFQMHKNIITFSYLEISNCIHLYFLLFRRYFVSQFIHCLMAVGVWKIFFSRIFSIGNMWDAMSSTALLFQDELENN